MLTAGYHSDTCCRSCSQTPKFPPRWTTKHGRKKRCGIHIPGGSHHGKPCESRERFEALFNGLDRGNGSVGYCSHADLRASRQGSGAVEVSPRATPNLMALPLYRTPFSIKDIFDTKDMRSTGRADVAHGLRAQVRAQLRRQKLSKCFRHRTDAARCARLADQLVVLGRAGRGIDDLESGVGVRSSDQTPPAAGKVRPAARGAMTTGSRDRNR